MDSELAKHAREGFGGVVDELVARNPKLAKEAHLASLVEGFKAPEGVSHSGSNEQVAARPVGNMSRSNETGIA